MWCEIRWLISKITTTMWYAELSANLKPHSSPLVTGCHLRTAFLRPLATGLLSNHRFIWRKTSSMACPQSLKAILTGQTSLGIQRVNPSIPKKNDKEIFTEICKCRSVQPLCLELAHMRLSNTQVKHVNSKN